MDIGREIKRYHVEPLQLPHKRRKAPKEQSQPEKKEPVPEKVGK